MKNGQKLTEIFGKIEHSDWEDAAREWKKQQPWRTYAQEIALEVLELLEVRGMSQKAFSEKMNVSPQAVNKWLKGKENFTLETIAKMEFVLGEKLIKIEHQEEQEAAHSVEVILPVKKYEAEDLFTTQNLSFSKAQFIDLHMPYLIAEN